MVEYKGENVPLYGDENIEPLGGGYNIIQSKSYYRFGSDAVALAHFAAENITNADRALDLCSGCGIIGIMLNIERGCAVTGVEIDKRLFDMSERSARLNGLDRVKFINADAREFCVDPSDKFDAVVCNPPYYKINSKPALVAPAANSELSVTLSDITEAARRTLKTGGALYMSHITNRLDEVIYACNESGLTVKRLVINKNLKTFLLRAVLGAKQHLDVQVKEYK